VDDNHNLCKELGHLSETIKALVTITGKMSQSILALNIYSEMETDVDKEDKEVVSNLKTDLAVFISKVNEWMSSTTEYRKSLCDKVDAINNNIAHLPCAERKQFYANMTTQLRTIWGIIVLMLGVIVAEFFRK